MKPGDLVDGRYQIENVLGSGGMGTVYLAEDRSLGKKVALKTLLPSMMTDMRAVDQLKKEVRTAQVLRHPYICATFDFHEKGGVPFLVMEYIDGTLLTNHIYQQRGNRCSETEFRRLADMILDALGHAHKAGVVHRDLKSANIMVNGAGEVRVMDFGIAANIKETYSHATGSSISLSVHYASPEQINGEAPSPAMDIYSIGCVFYEMLCGHPPFHQGEILHQQLTAQAAPILGVSPELNLAVMGCLVKDRRKRLQSTDEVKAALAGQRTVRVQRSRPANAASSAVEMKSWVPHIWAAVGVLVALALVLIVMQLREHAKGSPASRELSPNAIAPYLNLNPKKLPPVDAPPPSPAASPEATVNEDALAQMLIAAAAEFENGRYDSAIAEYRAVLALDSRNVNALQGLGKAQSAKQAEAQILGGSGAANAGTEAAVLRARGLIDGGSYAAAIQELEGVLRRSPGDAGARRALEEAKRAKEAEDRVFGRKP